MPRRFISARCTQTPFLHLRLTRRAFLTVLAREMPQGWFWPEIKWRYFHYRCHDFRFYVTLFPKYFSNFRSRYLFAIGLPTLYLTLADTYLPLNTALPSSATRLCHVMRHGFLAQMGYHLLWLNTQMKGSFQQWVCFALEFCQSRTNHS